MQNEQNNEGHLRLVREGNYEHGLSDDDVPQICRCQPRKGVPASDDVDVRQMLQATGNPYELPAV